MACFSNQCPESPGLMGFSIIVTYQHFQEAPGTAAAAVAYMFESWFAFPLLYPCPLEYPTFHWLPESLLHCHLKIRSWPILGNGSKTFRKTFKGLWETQLTSPLISTVLLVSQLIFIFSCKKHKITTNCFRNLIMFMEMTCGPRRQADNQNSQRNTREGSTWSF